MRASPPSPLVVASVLALLLLAGLAPAPAAPAAQVPTKQISPTQTPTHMLTRRRTPTPTSTPTEMPTHTPTQTLPPPPTPTPTFMPTSTPTRQAGGMGSVGPGSSSGEPHVRTLDGLAYDFQAAGEFVLAAATTGDLVVQVRQEPWLESTVVSINTAVAMNVAGDRVGFAVGAQPLLRINGEPASLNDGARQLPGGGRIERKGDYYAVVWPDQSRVEVFVRSQYLDVIVRLAADRAGQVAGLLGNGDGDAANDLATRAGIVIDLAGPAEAVHARLYGEFGASWRISQDESLFAYGAGEDTLTYTRLDFPSALVTADDLPPDVRQQAETLCRDAGIAAASFLTDCTLDVGLTGEAAFAASTAQVEALVGGEVEGEAPTYVSPSYGYTITYDTATWEVIGESSEVVGGFPEDSLALESPRSLAAFIGTTRPGLADAQACVEDFALALFAENPVRRGGVDAGSDRDAVIVLDGETNWGREGKTEVTFYLRCQTLALPEGYLVTLYVAPSSEYGVDASVREALLAGVEIG